MSTRRFRGKQAADGPNMKKAQAGMALAVPGSMQVLHQHLGAMRGSRPLRRPRIKAGLAPNLTTAIDKSEPWP